MDIPITIITGYLGAGKTTLLQRIAKKSGKKIAILMNEFGAIAIDSKIIEGKNIQMAELAGGCVCCSLSREFEAAIAEIIERVNPEWIVVETTGVAEPSALAYDIVENIAGVKLDAIVTIVDCDSILKFPNLGHTGREQIELADILVMNKIDLIPKKDIEEVEKRLRKINDRAIIIYAEHCDINLRIIFGIERSIPIETHKTHDIGYEYFEYISNEIYDHEKFVEFLKNMPNGIYRSKGFVKTNKGCFLMNFVAGRHSFEKFQNKTTDLIFIGENILSQKEDVTNKLKNLTFNSKK
jgi:G3E family GTPase